MKNLALTSAIIATLACLSGPASAADIYAGNGIGFSNGNVNPATGASPTGPWVANIIFNKNDLKANAVTTVKTGDDITHKRQRADAAKNGNTQVMPKLKSMSWCDDGVKSLMSSTPESGKCYGWSMHSRWIVLDLNALKKAGLTNVWVSITAKKYDDGTASEVDSTGKSLPSDDDLVPALTVFQGRQDEGVHLHWFPSQFQQMSDFWAWKLTPFTGGATQSTGWSTAYMASGSLDSANVMGRVKLKADGQNYLTVAVGGDAKHATAAEKHDVNFQLDVVVSKTKPSSGGGSSSGAKFDKCGCEVGKTQWHASMNHCMAIDLCEPIAGTDDQCKTPAMCEKDGGR